MLNSVGFNLAPQTQKKPVSFGINASEFNSLLRKENLSIITSQTEGGLFGTLGKITQNSKVNYAGLNPIKTGKAAVDSIHVIARGTTFGQLTQKMANLIKKGDSLYEIGKKEIKFLTEV